MKQRKVLVGQPLEGRPGWEKHDSPYLTPAVYPLIGKAGTIVEETEVVANSQAISRRILRIADNGEETVITHIVTHA